MTEDNITAKTEAEGNGLVQPEGSLELMQTVIAELSKLTDESKISEVYGSLSGPADKLKEQLLILAAHPKPSSLYEFAATYELPPPIEVPEDINTQLKDYLHASFIQRRALAMLIVQYFQSFPFIKKNGHKPDSSVIIEDDETGYYIANLVMFADMIDKITDAHQQALKEIQSAYMVVIANGKYPPAFRKKLQHLASLYLFRHHTPCAGCKATNSIVGKSLLQDVPLCLKCIKLEEDSLRGFIAIDPKKE